MVSMRVTVMAVTLVVLCVLATNMHAAYIYCCRRYILVKIPFSEIKGFSLQKGELCPISAIIFHTKKGKRCADPTEKWVMDYVSQIENMAMISIRSCKHAPDYFNHGGSCSSVALKDHQKPKPRPKPRPKQSLTVAPVKIITDGPLPVKLCKW